MRYYRRAILTHIRPTTTQHRSTSTSTSNTNSTSTTSTPTSTSLLHRTPSETLTVTSTASNIHRSISSWFTRQIQSHTNIHSTNIIMSASSTSSTTPTSSSTSATSKVELVPNSDVHIQPRRSKDRGSGDHGWLNSYHTFSFSSYYEPEFASFHSLRVINEDRVSGGGGFPRHPHREYEIFSYIVSGALKHEDSLGHKEILPRGSVQFTSAGTGISHSEFNASKKEDDPVVHFLQLWVKPNQSGLKPSYTTKEWSDTEKTNQLRLIVSPDGRNGSIVIHQDMSVYASILLPPPSSSTTTTTTTTTTSVTAASSAPAASSSSLASSTSPSSTTLSFTVEPGREVYIHLIQDATGYNTEANQTELTLNSAQGEIKLKGGDGAFLRHGNSKKSSEPQTFTMRSTGVNGAKAEFLLFDVKKEN